MKNKAFYAFLFVCLLVIPGAFAASYELELSQYGEKILEKHMIVLDNAEEIEVNLPEKYTSLEVLNNYSIINNKLIVKGDYIEFSFVNPGGIDVGEKYYFNERIAPGISLDSLAVTLVLDEGFVVSEDIYPQGYEIGSDGRRIIVAWYFENLSEDDSVPVFVIIDSVKGLSYFWLILIVIIIALAAWIAYPKIKEKLSKERAEKKPVKKKTKEDSEKHLLDNERKVYDELKKENGLWQKQLQLKTGLNKVKLSRVIKNLESRGFIRKENFGKANKIYLKR